MDQSANIAAGVKQLFSNNAPLFALIPGGMLFGAIKAGTIKPYASVEITLEGEPDYQTSLNYIQEYALTIKVWGDQLVGDAGTMQITLETLIRANTKFNTLTNNAWTLHCSLDPAGIAESPMRDKGQNVFIAAARWRIQLQETRS